MSTWAAAGFVDWHEFDHPQLGKVEIGGWTHLYTFRNPPPASVAQTAEAKQFLFDTIHSNCLFTLKHAMTAPLLRIRSTVVERLADDLFKLSASHRQRWFPADSLDAARARTSNGGTG